MKTDEIEEIGEHEHLFKDGVCQLDNCGFDLNSVMEFTFDEASHTYQLNGKKLTGTTTILGVLAKPALIGWAARMAAEHIAAEVKRCFDDDGKFVAAEFSLVVEEGRTKHAQRKDDAAVHGKDAHKIVEEWIKYCIKDHGGKPMPVAVVKDEQGETYDTESIKKFMQWSVEYVGTFVFSERKMYDAQKWFAGTADFAYIDKEGKRWMGDFKTSSGIYGIDYFLQVAAYRYLAELAGDDPYDGLAIVRLGKDGKFEVQMTREYELFRDTFFACLTIYRAQARATAMIEKYRERTRPKKDGQEATDEGAPDRADNGGILEKVEKRFTRTKRKSA